MSTDASTSAAICHRCGGPKRGPFVPCKVCGFTPSGEERSVAWLFSREHLSEDELAEAAARVRSGERPDPSRALIAQAHAGMGAVPASTEQQRPLRLSQVLSLLAANLLLTPLAGLAVWFGLREERPVAARQAIWATVPVALLLSAGWLLVWIQQLAP